MKEVIYKGNTKEVYVNEHKKVFIDHTTDAGFMLRIEIPWAAIRNADKWYRENVSEVEDGEKTVGPDKD